MMGEVQNKIEQNSNSTKESKEDIESVMEAMMVSI
jgi:hypothetical protein